MAAMTTSWRRSIPCLAFGAYRFSCDGLFVAVCRAVQLAYDDATHAVYNDGWQGTTTNNDTGVQETTGDNGGFGFRMELRHRLAF